MTNDVDDLFQGILEFENNLFSVNGIKNYMMIFMKNPMLAITSGFLYMAWKLWQAVQSTESLWGFLAVVVIFAFVLYDGSKKTTSMYRETKSLQIEIEEYKLKIAEKNIDIITANAKMLLDVNNKEFMINYLKRNINILHREVIDEISYITDILHKTNVKDMDVPAQNILMDVLSGTAIKIGKKVNRIDANAEAIGMPLEELKGKMTTGEIKPIPPPKFKIRKETMEKLKKMRPEEAEKSYDLETEEGISNTIEESLSELDE